MSEGKQTKANYPPEIRVVEKKVKTIEGYPSDLVRSLEEDRELRARQEEETRKNIAYMKEQYENQVMLNQQMAAQWKMLEQTRVESAQMKTMVEQLSRELESRPRASSRARWGVFGERDEDMESKEEVSEGRTHLSAGADLPIPPIFKGYTQSHKREFMDKYLLYDRKVTFINESTTSKVVRMPVRACIDQKTAVRICRYQFGKPENEVTEEQWRNYFLEASSPDLTRLASLEKALSNLKMSEEFDGNSRVDKLLHDFLGTLDTHNMESYDLMEPKLCVRHLVNAIRPYALRQTVKTALKSQQAKKCRENIQEFIIWLRPQVIAFSLFEEGLKSSEEYASKKKQLGSESRKTAGQRHSQKTSCGNQWVKSNQKLAAGKTAAKTSGDQKAETKGNCLKCQSPEHSVFNCPEATQEEARTLWEAFKKSRVKTAKIGGVTKLCAPQEKSVFLDAVCGEVSIQALTDFGASASVISSSGVKRLLDGNGSVQVKTLKRPVIAVGFSGDDVQIRKEATLNLKLQTRAGALMLTNVKCWVLPKDLPEGLGDVLLSRGIMQKLGYSPQQLIENARKHCSVLDASDLNEMDTLTASSDGQKVGAIGAMLSSQPTCTSPPLEEESLEEEISQQFTPTWSGERLEEEKKVRNILKEKVEEARMSGCPGETSKKLEEMLMEFVDCFRVELGRDPPVDVDPLEVRCKEGVEPVKCKARRYSPTQMEFLDTHVAALEAAGLVYKNNKSRWASPPLIVSKPDGSFRMTVDVRMVNDRTERLVWPMPVLEVITSKLRGSAAFFCLDFFKGYWQLPLAKNSQEFFSFITDSGVYTPTRVLMGGSDSVAYCQSAVQEMFSDLLYKGLLVWLDDLLGYVTDPKDIVSLLRKVLVICRTRGLKLNPKKCQFWLVEALWCGRIVSGTGVRHNPDRVQALQQLPSPSTGSDLQQFICAVNWMRTSIPGFNKLVQPLQALMERVYAAAGGRTKRKAAKVSLLDVGWCVEHDNCLSTLKSALSNMVMLSHPDPEKRLCVYTDASEYHWGAMVSQVPLDHVDRDVESQAHEPLMFLSGTFSGAAKHWAIVEKEAFAILETCKRADFLLRRPGGFHLFTDHRNLQYIFNPTSVVSTVPKYTADKLQRWAIMLMSYQYVIHHIPGESNVWADLLSRWGSPLATVCALVQVQPQESPLLSEEFVWPTVPDLKIAQSTAISKNSSWCTDLWKGGDGLYYTANEQVLVPDEASELQLRLLVVAHFSVGGHRGAKVTADIVKRKFWWSTIDEDVKLFVEKCLHCASASGEWVHRPLGETLHAEKPNELLHFDYIYMGESEDGYEYILVLKDDASKFLWMLPAKAADSGFVADSLLQWFASFGVCHSWVSDQGTHFKNQVIGDLKRVLGANHHFTTARCPWANGTVERAMREILRCARVLLSEWRLPTNKWDKVVSVIQMVLNQSPLSSLGNEAPITGFTGLKPMSPVEKIVARSGELRVMTLQELQESKKFNLSKLQAALEELHKTMSNKAAATRHQAKKKAQGQMANFEIGDYVLYADVWAESKNKLLTKWNGPAMVSKTISPWIYMVKSLITGEEREVHASRLKFYADNSLEVTGAFMDMVAHNSEGHVVHFIKAFRFNKQKAQHEFLVSWRGLSEAEDSWEPAQQLFEDVPTLVKQFCQQLPPSVESEKLIKIFKWKSSPGGSVVDPTPEVSKNAECLVQNTSGTSKKKPVRKKQA